ncbi:porin family protein [Bradyrhizobium sp. UFLA05-109]
MKKYLIALAAVAAMTGSASAADLGARPYTKAPVAVSPVANWTGLWISGGFGYGLAQYQHSENDTAAPFALISTGQDAGLKGWLGKVGLGYDYQFAGPMGNWVIGAFADTDWSNISGQYNVNTSSLPIALLDASNLTGSFKNDWSWAVGARIGYVALPGLLTYFNGGYTQAHFATTNYADTTSSLTPAGTGISLGSQTRGGYFLGGGTEYAVSQLPGLFWKNEVRFSSFGNKTNNAVCTVATGCGLGPVFTQTSRVYEQKATTELVYRFNWAGPAVAKY